MLLFFILGLAAFFLRNILFRKSILIPLCALTVFIGFFGFCLKETEPENLLFQGMGVYVINLDRSPHRLKHMQKIFEPTGFEIERIAGIDGSQLSEKQVRLLLDPHFHAMKGNYLGKGAIGCSLSHIKAWKRFLESDHAFALICEDDISFDPQTLKQTLKKLMQRADMFDLCTLELLNTRPGLPFSIANLGEHHLVVYFKSIIDAGCYLINRKAAARLLEQALPLRMPVDVYFSRSWELGIKFTGIEPRIVHQVEKTTEGQEIKSDIRSIGRQTELEDSTSLMIQRKMYSFAGDLMRILHTLDFYLYVQLKKLWNLHL